MSDLLSRKCFFIYLIYLTYLIYLSIDKVR